MKSYLIAGASSGIGKELAYDLSSEDTFLVLAARRRDKLEEIGKTLRGKSLIIPTDLTCKEEIQKLYDVIKSKGIKLNGMVYTAGICFSRTVKTVKMQDLEDMFRINLFGFHEMSRLFCSAKYSEKGASVVGMSSYAAYSCEAGMSTYSMTKEAMNVLVRVLAKECSKRRIRVNSVLPAIVQSKMTEDNTWTDGDLAAVRQKQDFGVIPIEQVVECIKFLLSDSSSYITGESIKISAGYHG